MAQGKNNAAVAASLVLSERAVEKHINSIFFKLGLTEEPDVHRRVKAVLLFLAAQTDFPRHGGAATTARVVLAKWARPALLCQDPPNGCGQ